MGQSLALFYSTRNPQCGWGVVEDTAKVFKGKNIQKRVAETLCRVMCESRKI